MVVAAIVMLWFQPARDWFDGVSPAGAGAGALPPTPSTAGRRDPLLDLPPPTAPPLHPTPYAAGPAAPARSRPGRGRRRWSGPAC